MNYDYAHTIQGHYLLILYRLGCRVEGYPMIYFYPITDDLYSYNGGGMAEDIISFIKKNKGPRAGAVDEVTQTAMLVLVL